MSFCPTIASHGLAVPPGTLAHSRPSTTLIVTLPVDHQPPLSPSSKEPLTTSSDGVLERDVVDAEGPGGRAATDLEGHLALLGRGGRHEGLPQLLHGRRQRRTHREVGVERRHRQPDHGPHLAGRVTRRLQAVGVGVPRHQLDVVLPDDRVPRVGRAARHVRTQPTVDHAHRHVAGRPPTTVQAVVERAVDDQFTALGGVGRLECHDAGRGERERRRPGQQRPMQPSARNSNHWDVLTWNRP